MPGRTESHARPHRAESVAVSSDRHRSIQKESRGFHQRQFQQVSENLENLLPGADLVREGLADLARGELSEPALLVLIGSPRLRRLGIAIPAVEQQSETFEHQLYDRLEARLGRAAHSYYNSLIRRLVSYEHALERE